MCVQMHKRMNVMLCKRMIQFGLTSRFLSLFELSACVAVTTEVYHTKVYTRVCVCVCVCTHFFWIFVNLFVLGFSSHVAIATFFTPS
jgi:hypothetical protein